jgi:hypothetical protein
MFPILGRTPQNIDILNFRWFSLRFRANRFTTVSPATTSESDPVMVHKRHLLADGEFR